MKKRLLSIVALVAIAFTAVALTMGGIRKAEAVSFDVPTDTELGAFIAEKVTANPGAPITLNLAAGGTYTMTTDPGQLPVDAAFTITSDAKNRATITWANKPIRGGKALTIENVIIDASSATGHFINMNEPTEEIWGEGVTSGTDVFWTIDEMKFENILVKGLKKAFFLDQNKPNRFIIKDFTIDNSVFEITNPGNVTINFQAAAVEKFTIKNSTVYNAETATSKGFLGMGGKRIWQAPGYESTAEAKITFENNTFYYNQTQTAQFFNTNAYKNQKQCKVNWSKNIFVGIPTNTFEKFVNSAATAEAMLTTADNTYMNPDGTFWKDSKYDIPAGIEEDPGFKDAAAGDFTVATTSQQATKRTGDPRWLPAADITIAPASGDIKAALDEAIAAVAPGKVGNITINLTANGAYTVSGSIEAPASVAINGAEGAKIDASALEAPMILMSETPVVDANEKGAFPIDGITIKDVKVTGLKYQLLYANEVKYLMGKVLVENSIIGIDGTNKKTIFDFADCGNTEELVINKSTIYANPALAQAGGLTSSQSGDGAVQDLGGTKQVLTITNSTLYNISYGKNTNTQRRNGQAGQAYEVKNSVIVNCGKKGEFIVGLNGGQKGNPTYTIDNNIFNYDGADFSANEATKLGAEINSVAGVIAFTSTETPDFGGTVTFAAGKKGTAPATVPGDPRWTINFQENPNNLWIADAPIAVNWNGDAVVPAANLANVKVGDVLHVVITDVAAGATADNWQAQVAPKDGNLVDIEGGKAVAEGQTEVTFEVTGDILARIKASGLMLSGNGYSAVAVYNEPEVYSGADNSIWVGNTTGKPTINLAHFVNADVAAGDKIIIKATAVDPAPENVYLVLSYSGSDTSWSWVNYDVNATAVEGGFEVVVTDAMVEQLKKDGLIINQEGYKLTEADFEKFVPTPEDIVISPATGKNITEELEAALTGKAAKNITINLAADGQYTITKSIEAPASVAINGAEGAKIDASGLEGALINYASVLGEKAMKDETTESNYTIVANLTVKDVEITGLAQSFVNNAAGNVLFKTVLVDNANIEIVGSKAIFALGNGFAEDLKITNSTLWSKEGHTGFLFQAQGRPAKDINAEAVTSYSIDKSTLYKIGFNTKMNNNNSGIKGQTCLHMSLTNSILMDTNTKDPVTGWLFGQTSDAPTIKYENNVYWTSEGEATGWTDAEKTGSDQTGTAIKSEPKFKAAATGDFTLLNCAANTAKVGDPRWIDEALATAAAALDEAIDTATDKLGETPTDVDPGKALADAIAAAQAALDNADSTAEELAAAKTALEQAVEAFTTAVGIDSISADAQDKGAWYTLQGVRVEKPTKGLFIHNGKKVVVK